MILRFKRWNLLIVSFNLRGGQENGKAYSFLHGGLQTAALSGDEKATLSRAIKDLERDVRTQIEASHMATCPKCGREINLNNLGSYTVEHGVVRHQQCNRPTILGF